MNKFFSVCALFVSSIIYSQNYQTVEEIDKSCAILGFASNEEAEIAVDEILDELGLPRSFKIQECPDINNAIAKIITAEDGTKVRYILYDNAFFNRISDKTSTAWSSKSILAHEIGHHLNGHSLTNKGSTHEFELEADYFSGVVLAKLGANLEEAQSAIQSLRYEKATATHPAKADRLAIIAKGWNEEMSTEVTVEIIEVKKEEDENNEVVEVKEEDEKKEEVIISEEVKEEDEKKEEVIEEPKVVVEIKEEDEKKEDVIISEEVIEVKVEDEKNEEDELVISDKMDILTKGFYYKALKGNMEAQFSLGYRYHKGRGAVKDIKKALYWYNESAKKGSSNAMNQIGYIFLKQKKDKIMALDWFEKAAKKGNLVAMENAAHLYSDKETEDVEQALYWYKELAKNGKAKVYQLIGRIYMQGSKEIEKNDELAFEWFKKVKEAGIEDVMYLLGYHYLDLWEDYGARDYEKALYWFRKASSEGSRNSDYWLGYMYRRGVGVKKNKKLSKKYWENACNAGVKKACN